MTPLLLIPAGLGAVAIIFLVNRKKVHEWNKRFEARNSIPKLLRPTFGDPDGRMNTIGAVLMLVIAVLAFLVIGAGFLDD